MPIRIRHENKTVETLPDSAIFVELVNDYGEIVAVLTENPKNNSYKFFDSDSLSAKKYAAFYQVPFVKQVINLKYKDIDNVFNNINK